MISVIMPAYNGERYIGEAIESILNQTFRELELIVVDDGSNDSTVEIVQGYVDRDNRVRLLQNEHGGACKARNTAIEAARYPWIAAMDADDVALPERLSIQYAHAQDEPDVVVWGSYMMRMDANGDDLKPFDDGPTSKDAFYQLDLTQEIISLYNPTALFKRDVALAVGGYDPNPLLVAGQDSELWDRMADHGPIVVIPQILLRYRMHGSSISTQKMAKQKMLLTYPPARRRAQAAGQDLTLEQFIADYNDVSPWEKATRALHNQSDAYYRKALNARSDGQNGSARLYHLMGAALRPGRTIGNAVRKVTGGSDA